MLVCDFGHDQILNSVALITLDLLSVLFSLLPFLFVLCQSVSIFRDCQLQGGSVIKSFNQFLNALSYSSVILPLMSNRSYMLSTAGRLTNKGLAALPHGEVKRRQKLSQLRATYPFRHMIMSAFVTS